MLNRRCFIAAAATTGFGLAFGGPGKAQAQTISKNARLLVGFPPGGSVDVVARLLVEHLKGYAPSIIVENRAGAGGRIALESLKAAEPDGSQLVLTPGDQITLLPHVYRKLGYDPLTDFAPATTVCNFPFLLAVGPMVPSNVTTLPEFVRWCRANPKLATYGSPGAGTRPHFLGVTLARAAGFEFVHLPYKGGAAAMQDLLGGQVAASISVLSNALPHVQSGTLRPLVTTAPRRSSLLPDVPTAREAGYPGMEAVEWFGLLLPGKTPAAIVNALHAAVLRALDTEAFRAGLAKQSFEAVTMSPTDLSALVKTETERWGEIVRASGFQPAE